MKGQINEDHTEPAGEPASSYGNRLADVQQNVVAVEGGVIADGLEKAEEEKVKQKDEPVTWRSLPHRRQLIVLTLARLSEPLVDTSLRVCITHH